MWREAFLVAAVAGGWAIVLYYLPQIITVLSQKESKAMTWWLLLMRGVNDAFSYAVVIPAALTGWVLGDLKTGLIVGGTVQAMFIGVFIVGASIPPNPYLASILSTALVILTGASTGEALALVVPVAVVSQLLTLAFMSLNVVFCHWGDKMAADGNAKGVDILNTLDGMGWTLTNVIPAFLGVALGIDAASKLLNIIPGWLADGLGYAGGVLPALGIAMLLLIIASKEVWSFFFLGFIAAVYLNLNAVAGAILGVIIAVIFVQLKSGNDEDKKAKGI
ncbi:MAG: PTS sugar transporter subunit IIC [Chloroflexi bacterium]|nr:PTS sugar transporter subunit IIC [Chloroflexota bacterium]